MRRPAFVFTLALSLLVLVTPRAAGTQASDAPSSAEPGAELRVFLMTFSAGSAIYEKFGHNTICIHDPTPSEEAVGDRAAFDAWWRRNYSDAVPPVAPFLPTDKAYHYGAFDFEQENFVWRFLHGLMDYWMASAPADYTAWDYARQDRAVLLQELDLSPARKLEVQRYLEENERPENRVYRYDYYRDNCSTRVRDVIDRGTGGELMRQLAAVRTDATYRSHTRRVTGTLDAEGLFWFTSFTYVLGHPVDERLTAWEEAFLPDALSAHVRSVQLPDGRGGTRPLVLGEVTLAETTRPPVPQSEPHRTPGYAVAGLLIGGSFVGLAALAGRSRVGRAGFAVLVVPWVLLWGVGATIGTYGWAATDHGASYRNENLLQMTPLMLPLAYLAPAVAFGRRRGARLAVRLGAIAATLSVLGFLLQALPWFWQRNGEIVALAVPANVGLAAALVILGRRAGRADVAVVPEGQPPPARARRSKQRSTTRTRQVKG
jgi:hypothetical protein